MRAEYGHRYQQARGKARRQFINTLKVEAGCIDCGYNESPWALEFDHRDRSKKSIEVAKLIKSNMERLLAEIAKCDIRCANCHAVKTHEGKEWESDRGVYDDPQLRLLDTGTEGGNP